MSRSNASLHRRESEENSRFASPGATVVTPGLRGRRDVSQEMKVETGRGDEDDGEAGTTPTAAKRNGH